MKILPASLLASVLALSVGHQANAQTLKAFYIGHSLSDQIAEMVQSLTDDTEGVYFDWRYQSIPGAPLIYQWERMAADDYTAHPPHIYPFYDPANGLPAGDFDVLVMVDSVPRQSEGEWGISMTYTYSGLFLDYAQSNNPGIQVYFYEPWHCINSGTPTGCDWDIDSNPWRQRLIDDLPMWESVVDYLNTHHSPTHPVQLIPGGQGLARLYDAIAADEVPGLSSIEDLFDDDIHLSNVGKYYIACIHYAVLHDQSPVGLTNQLKNTWGGDFDPAPTPEQAAIFQALAWETVTEYRARAGYLTWRTNHFDTAEIDAGAANPDADPHETGIPNWLHYLFGDTPGTPASTWHPLSLHWLNDEPLLQFQVRRDVPQTMWWIETRTNLLTGAWQQDENRLPVSLAVHDAEFDDVTVPDSEPPDSSAFYRLIGRMPFDWE